VLDPVLLAALGDLELVAKLTVEGSVSGLHRSPFHGYSAEFSQYRHYRAGDDLKYVDWKLFARTDRFYTKQYRETTNMAAEIALDASGSMAYGGRTGVTKIEYARMLSAALAHLISRQGDAVGLAVYDDALRQFVGSRSGASHLRTLLHALWNVEASGRTSAAPALRRAADLLRRRGLLLIVSDLYDESGEVEREVRRAVRMGHEVAVFHVLTAEEIELPFDGDVELEDLEGAGSVVTSAAAIRERYLDEMKRFVERWRARCTGQGIDYTLARTDAPLDEVLRRYLLGRTARTRQ
jgi:uncharacterized protein (DUF58 family)